MRQKRSGTITSQQQPSQQSLSAPVSQSSPSNPIPISSNNSTTNNTFSSSPLSAGRLFGSPKQPSSSALPTAAQTSNTNLQQQKELMEQQRKAALELAEFKLNDCHPRKQRHFLFQLKQQQLALQHSYTIPPISSAPLSRKEMPQVPKMKSKDIELPFKKSSSSASSKLTRIFASGQSASVAVVGSLLPSLATTFSSGSGNSSPVTKKHSPDVTLHLARLAIMDNKQDLAFAHLQQLPSTFLKKKQRPFELNTIFLLAMAHRMENVCLLMLDRGFPSDVNSPIYFMKYSKKVTIGFNKPFRINTELFPSWFVLAVSMGYETLVRLMIKKGAFVNQTYYGLTPLHIATYCNDGNANVSLINLLLEFGADPWIGIHWEQIHALYRLKDSYRSAKDEKKRMTRTWRVNSNAILEDDSYSASNSGLFQIRHSFLSLAQRPIPQSTGFMPQFREKSSELIKANISVDKKLLTDKKRGPVSMKSDTELSKAAAKIRGASTESLANSDNSRLMSHQSAEKIQEWQKDKFILPVAFCASLGNRNSAIMVLVRMSQVRPKKPSLTHLATGSQGHIPASPSNRSASISSMEKPTYLIKQVQKDSFCLLVQQDLELTIYLLKSGLVDTLQKDPRGATALHLAVRAGLTDLIQVLLHFDNADSSLMNARGEGGWTALHEAISRKNFEIFRLLVKKGALNEIRNDQGDTPEDLAKKVGVDPTDYDHLWHGTLKRSKSVDVDSSTTIMHGAGAEFLSHLDSRLIQLINMPAFDDKRKSGLLLDFSGSGGNGSSPLLKRSTTITGNLPIIPLTITANGSSGSPSNSPSTPLQLGLASFESSTSQPNNAFSTTSFSSSSSSSTVPSSNNSSTPPKKEKRQGTMRPFNRLSSFLKKKSVDFSINSSSSSSTPPINLILGQHPTTSIIQESTLSQSGNNSENGSSTDLSNSVENSVIVVTSPSPPTSP